MENQKKNQSIKELSANLLEVLKSKGYSSHALTFYRLMLSRISVFMQRMEIDNYTESVGELFFADYITKKNYSKNYHQHIKKTLRRLYELSNGIDFRLFKQSPEIPSPPQFEGLLESYIKYCTDINNKENTIAKKRRICLDFLCEIAEAGCKNICDINANYICKAILKTDNKDSYAIIRSFLQHLYENRKLDDDFSRIIPKYRIVIPLPTTYTDNEINRLEKCVNRITREGKRDYAIILLASRLGMRSGDIAEMTFDTIDFSRNSISFIQKKTGQPLSLPLLPEIRDAILEYIQHARPNVKNNFLFIRINAPFEKISTSIINHVFTKYFKIAGIDTANKRHGPHSLRSSMASSMVNSNIPYDVIRKVLGHTNPQAMKHYAKVDIENLRLHAIDVPAPTGTFAMFLKGRE